MNVVADYFELQIKINPEISEILSNICFENFECEGVVSAEEEYKDDLVLVSTTEGTLKAFLLSIEGVEAVLEGTRALLLSRGFSEEDLGSWEFEITKVENQDWSKKWKENWDVTHVSDRIAVVPSWLEYEPKSDEIVIDLDPGSAFGTGTHPTTQLCMRAIEKYLKPNDTIADIGMGSGILAICGVKFGAQFAYGCDNDELVIKTAQENARVNNVSDKCVFECNTADKIPESHVILNSFQDLTCERPCDPEINSGRREDESYKFDFICANILHNILAEIMGDLKAIMKDNATMVLSGILDEKKQVVLDAIAKHGLNLIEETHQDIWTGLLVVK